jgi:hypothetical protein
LMAILWEGTANPTEESAALTGSLDSATNLSARPTWPLMENH